MKENFLQQTSGYDCVPKAFENALIAVFGRGFVPVSAIQIIYKHSLDKGGTSKKATQKIITKLSKIPEIYTRKLTGNKASPRSIFEALKMGHSVVIPIWHKFHDEWYRHAVTATAIKGKKICIFDPELSYRQETLQSLRSIMNKTSFPPIIIGKSLVMRGAE